ncbi:MlaD family protein [Cupriavidus basilensis]|uniref:MlaD family protein n=1 Tax=Cupriavidus basilensis TaxID=68895 RepID=A0ABT6AJG0_9BURK|nr:MlaD family protein [Cupriavidus basilensis]MDF3831911.1 MlaD family protein [Cupriavidus basilensis]
MESDINTKARLTLAVLLLILAIVGITWYAFSEGRYVTYQLNTQESVSGLIADAPVEFHGVEVGKVKRVGLVNPRTVSVLLSIEKTAPVTAASVATITSRGLATRGFTGYVYISIEDIGVDPRPLAKGSGEPYPVIPSAPAKVETLDTSMGQVNENFQVVSTLLESLLDKPTIASLQQSADSLQQITKVLADNTSKLNTMLASTARASQRLEPLLDASHDSVKALQTQILPQTYKALSDLEKLSGSLSDLTAKIDRDPSILIRGTVQPPLGPGEKK